MTEPVSFIKMHGIGNDFVIIDSRIHSAALTSIAIKNICDRHFGIGCDQLIELLPPQKNIADIHMRIYNADASLSAACGNATRCVAALMMEESQKDTCIIETQATLLPCWVDDEGLINVDMGRPHFQWDQIPLAKNVPTDNVPLDIAGLNNPSVVNMGNPHTVFIVDDITEIALEKTGPQIEHHPLFPERTNVEFVQILSNDRIRMRVWERGSGITLACGSGACAAVVALAQKKHISPKATVELDGGSLDVEWRKQDQHVILSGPIAVSFGGSLSQSLWES